MTPARKAVARFWVRCTRCKAEIQAYRDRDDRTHFVWECVECGASGDEYLKEELVETFDRMVRKWEERMKAGEQPGGAC